MVTKKIESTQDAERVVALIHATNNLEEDINTLKSQIKRAEKSPEGVSQVKVKLFINGEGGASSPTVEVPTKTAEVFITELEKYRDELKEEIKSFGLKDA